MYTLRNLSDTQNRTLIELAKRQTTVENFYKGLTYNFK